MFLSEVNGRPHDGERHSRTLPDFMVNRRGDLCLTVSFRGRRRRNPESIVRKFGRLDGANAAPWIPGADFVSPGMTGWRFWLSTHDDTQPEP